ncbi:hypothetical protein I5U59_09505 [Stenotrophomonas maltophilia]|nr:hypothetical protein [Stenotrophomonas maltophilia]MBH1503311.1 hypothetical protein [Stenotrophomonas maltophilia]
MTTDNKTAPVDVLAVMEEDADRIDAEFGEGTGDKLRNARAVVSELIQIALEFSDYVAIDHNDTSLLDRKDLWDRLGSAVSRVKGEAA